MNKKFSLSDVIDIDFMQKFLDAFSLMMNMASCFCYDSDKVTKPSNFTLFCKKNMKSDYMNCKVCKYFDFDWDKFNTLSSEPIFYTCRAGLTNIAVPVVIAGKNVGIIFAGQVFSELRPEALPRNIDEEQADDYRQINKVSEYTIQDTANLLCVVAKIVSDFGEKNFLKMKKMQDDALYQDVVNTIRTSVDINETKHKIISTIGKTFGADRCIILEYDKYYDKFKNIDNEYLSSPEILSLMDRDPNNSVPSFVNLLKKGKPIIINNRNIYMDGELCLYEKETKIIEKYDIDSALVYPLYYMDEMLGVIAVHYVNKRHPVENNEIQLLSSIANQIAIAFYQAKLYDELKQTTSNQNAILNNIPYMAWLKDTQGNFLAVNDAFAKMCNTTINNLIGKSDYEFFPVSDAESYTNDDKFVMKNKHSISKEERIKGLEGSKYHETFKSPIFDENNMVIGTVGMARDITERKEIELELHRRHEKIVEAAEREKLIRELVSEISSTFDSEKIKKILVEKLGQALDSDFVVLYLIDQNTGKFMSVEESSIYASTENIKSLVGVNVMENYGFAQYVNMLERVELIYSDIEELKNDYNLSGKMPEVFFNEYKVKSIIGMPILYAGNFLGLLIINFTKGQRTFSEEELNLVRIITNQASIALHHSILYSQVQEASRAKSEFIANMSHEIKTPLNIIIGFSDLLAQSHVDKEKQLKYLENINKSGKHLLNLANDVINISKIESGLYDLNIEEISVKDFVKDAVESIKIMARAKNIKIDMDITEGFVSADKKMLIQILYNLLSNAIKFTPEFGNIKIKAGIKESELHVLIADNGIGIAQEHQNVIFEKFRQIDSSIERAQQGVGLGLAITKKLIELHNGSIKVESAPSKGSKFWFILPNAFKSSGFCKL